MNGLSVLGNFLFGIIFGLFILYESKRKNAKLLFLTGLIILFIGLSWMGVVFDFITIFLTGKNTEYPLIYIIAGFMWFPPLIMSALYLGAELMKPEKKWHILSPYIVLGVIFELYLFLDPLGSFVYIYPSESGEDLLDGYFILGSPLFILIIIFFSSMLILLGFGVLVKSFQAEGVIKKKYRYLSSGGFILLPLAILENLFYLGIFVVFVRIGMIFYMLLIYIGLREEPEKTKKKKEILKKEVKIKDSLFRLTERPDQITEEEVSFHREKKICLVCKGKLEKYIFLCSNCEVLYCENCARTLTILENACWVCNEPFDESKPTKPFKLDKEIIIPEPRKNPS